MRNKKLSKRTVRVPVSRRRPKRKATTVLVARVNPRKNNRTSGRRRRLMTPNLGGIRMNPYLHCHFNPFGGGSGHGIPDANETRTVVVENRTLYTYAAGAANDTMTFVALPLFGKNLHLGLNATGFTDGTWTSVSAFTDPLGLYQSFQEMRTVGLGLRVIPIGAPQTRSGAFFVGRLDVMCNNIMINDAEGTPQMFMNLTNNVVTSNTIISRAGGFIAPANRAVMAVGARISSGYDFKINNTTGFMTIGAQGYVPASTPSVFANDTQIFCYDSDIMTPIVRLEGTTTGQTYQVEVIHCIEGIPYQGNILAQAAKPSTPHDPLALRVAGRGASHSLVGTIIDTVRDIDNFVQTVIDHGMTGIVNQAAPFGTAVSALALTQAGRHGTAPMV